MSWVIFSRPCYAGQCRSLGPALWLHQPGLLRMQPCAKELRWSHDMGAWPGWSGWPGAPGRVSSLSRAPASALCCTALLALAAAAVPSFQVLRVPGDGSCMFRALAQGRHVLERGRPLGWDELLREGYQLRQEVCAAMLAARAELEPFIVGRFDAYVGAMMQEGTWGGEPELSVAATVLHRPVLVYQQVQSGLFGSDLEKVSEYGVDSFPDVPPVCLLFSGNHYDLLVSK